MSELILQNTVRGGLTEWCLFKPQLDSGDFVRNKIRTLYDRIVSDTLVNCLNIEKIVEDSIYSNTSSIVDKIGLKEIIIDTMLKSCIYNVRIEVVNNAIIYSKIKDPIVNSDPDDNILIVNSKEAPTSELYDYYIMIYEYMIFVNSVLKLANKPLIKFNDYRSSTTNLVQADEIKKQVTESLEMLKRENGFSILDAKDNVDMFSVNMDNYDKILTQAYNGIADTLGLPLSYFTGEVGGALNSLGEADRVKCQDVFLRYYKNILQNILKRIYDILGLEYKIVFKEYLEFKLKGILPVLQALERSSLLTDEKKQQYVTKIMD